MNMKIKILSLLALISVYSCTAISEKATEKAAKENAYLSTFLKAPSANLVKTFGKPTQTLAENDQTIYVYEVKGKHDLKVDNVVNKVEQTILYYVPEKSKKWNSNYKYN